jgi:translation initiation factor IF-1
VFRRDDIEVVGVVTEPVSGAAFRVEIGNGHRLLAYAPGKKRAEFAQLAAGDRVALRVSPFDLSVGRIVGLVKKQFEL